MKKTCGICEFFRKKDWSCRAAGKLCFRKPDNIACLQFKQLLKTCENCHSWRGISGRPLGECRRELSLDNFYAGTMKNDCCNNWSAKK